MAIMSFRSLLFLSCLTLVLNTLPFVTTTPVLPILFDLWDLSETEAGLLGGAFFIGYTAAVPILVSLTDRILPKKIYIVSGSVGVVSCFGFALLANDLWSGVFFRIMTGVGVAGTNMPALKALADSLEEPERSRASSYYTSVYAIGTAISIFSAGYFANAFGWQSAFIVAGLGFLLGLSLGMVVLPPGRVSKKNKKLIEDFKLVFRNRPVIINISSYFGHIWEVFANRVWIVTFLVFAEASQPGNFIISITLLATLVALIGVPASMLCGEASILFGHERVIRTCMVVSVVVGIVVAFSTSAPLWVIGILVLLYGTTGYADTGTINTATVSVANQEVRGATMALHSCVGCAGGILASLAIGLTLQNFGGRASANAWTLAFLVMASGSAFGYLVRWWAGRKTHSSSN